MDLMRLPLGIFTGVGFLGGGAILKKGGSITGLTTAATLWIATVIGLLFRRRPTRPRRHLNGVWDDNAFRHGMDRCPHPTRAHRSPCGRNRPGAPTPDLNAMLQPLGYRARLRQQIRVLSLLNVEESETRFDLSWRQVETEPPSLSFLAVVERACRVKSFEVVSGGEH